MKILHLYSDWKWTGPAEPTVILCEALQRRGNEVTIAYRRAPASSEDSIAGRISQRNLQGTDRFRLRTIGKRGGVYGLVDYWRDLFALRGFIDRCGFDLVNVHQSHDHIVGGIAARLSKKKPVVIRTDHKRDALRPSCGNRLLVSKLTDGIITFSEMAHHRDSRNLPIPADRVGRVGVALELERYDPSGSFRDMREVLNIDDKDVVVGTVARFQRYRRTEILLSALTELVVEFPHTKALLVGRSSQIRESVIIPMRRLGLNSNVVLAGYQRENYLDTLAIMDIFVFLVAGSDGTARALREAMALGKPAVVAKRGILPELVEDGATGFVVEDTPRGLSSALRRLIENEPLRDRMGRRAREKALKEFRLERQTEEVEGFYRKVFQMGPRVSYRGLG